MECSWIMHSNLFLVSRFRIVPYKLIVCCTTVWLSFFSVCCSKILKLIIALYVQILPDDIRQAWLDIVECCIRHDHLLAMERYIKLAIGNDPWPIEVTMVGIHERSAREKISANRVAHIMNDETTHQCLRSIKRLITLCEPRYLTQSHNPEN